MKIYDLSRFAEAQRRDYATALGEIRRGRKESHWMWYIFPQIRGLGFSSTSYFYGVEDEAEAKAFLADPYLGGNLTEISKALLELPTRRARDVFPAPDDKKLRSSMTLFACAAGSDSVFEQVLDRYFDGEKDPKTLEILQNGIPD